MKIFISLIYQYARKYTRLLAAAEICIIITYICSLILPLNLNYLIDNVILNEQHRFIAPVLMIYLSIFIVTLITNLIYSRVWQTLYNGMVVDVKNAVFTSIINAQSRVLNQINSGDMMERIDNDCNQFMESIVKNVFHLLNSIVLCIIIVVLVARYSILLSFLILISAMIPIVTSRLFTTVTEKYASAHRNTSGEWIGILFEMIKGYRELKLQSALEQSKKMLSGFLRKLIKIGNGIRRISLYTDKTIYLLNLAASCLLYIVSVGLIEKGTLTLGAFISIITYLALLHRKLNWILRITLDWRSRKVSINRVREVLSFEQEENKGVLIETVNEISFENVCFGYGGSDVLNNISFNIGRGDKLAIVGVSGVGKTTLIALVLKLYNPQYGSIKINNIDIGEINPFSLRNCCCVVSQEIILFDTSIRENLTMGRDIDENKIWKVLEDVGLKEAVENLPDSLDFIFSRGADLSGGQKQRLMIARAVLKNADLYILDEATNALDVKNEDDLMVKLLQNNVFKTAIVISHRYNAVRNCDKYLVLNEGRVESFSSKEKIRESSEMFNSLFPEGI